MDVLFYEPRHTAGPTPGVLWIHGGGLVTGAPEQNHLTCLRIAKEAGARVVNLNYRFAPEHPFPAGFNDCFHAFTWMHELASDLGIDPHRLAVAGESAGGGLATAVAQKAADQGLPVKFQMLVYPMLDDRTTLRHVDPRRGQFVWTRASNAFGWSAYLGREPRMDHAPEYAAPARRENLEGLAPRGSAWVIGICSMTRTWTTPAVSKPRGCRANFTLNPVCITPLNS